MRNHTPSDGPSSGGPKSPNSQRHIFFPENIPAPPRGISPAMMQLRDFVARTQPNLSDAQKYALFAMAYVEYSREKGRYKSDARDLGAGANRIVQNAHVFFTNEDSYRSYIEHGADALHAIAEDSTKAAYIEFSEIISEAFATEIKSLKDEIRSLRAEMEVVVRNELKKESRLTLRNIARESARHGIVTSLVAGMIVVLGITSPVVAKVWDEIKVLTHSELVHANGSPSNPSAVKSIDASSGGRPAPGEH